MPMVIWSIWSTVLSSLLQTLLISLSQIWSFKKWWQYLSSKNEQRSSVIIRSLLRCARPLLYQNALCESQIFAGICGQKMLSKFVIVRSVRYSHERQFGMAECQFGLISNTVIQAWQKSVLHCYIALIWRVYTQPCHTLSWAVKFGRCSRKYMLNGLS